ncbi:MAG: hypothetical protein WCO47_07580 [Methylococcus sp.]|jgi:hypothetical protein
MQHSSDTIRIVHNKVPHRLRVYVPMVRWGPTYADFLVQTLLREGKAPGVFHAEASEVTGNVLIQYLPGTQCEEDILRLLEETAQRIETGNIPLLPKHKSPRLGKMMPGAFFTRELMVSIGGNIIAGVALALMLGA